jgi:uncharacterized protein (DUF1501 family)
MDRMTRRRFLRAAAAGGTAYALAHTPGVSFAQMTGGNTLPGYKALVCVFLFGGNDSWNMLVPSSQAEYDVYAATRGGVQSAGGLAVERSTLLPLNLAVADPRGWQFGLNPAMPGLAQLFNAGRCAAVANVGPLVTPTSLAAYRAQSVALPPQLFSHNDQQDQWHSLRGRAPSKSGWAGRVADVLAAQTAAQQVPLNVSLFGQTLFQAGETSVPYTMGAAGPTTFTGLGTTGLAQGRRQAFTNVLNASYGTIYERGFANVQKRALQSAELVSAALQAAPDLAALPNSSTPALSNLATQLRTVAKLIAVRDRLQMSRQVFFVAAGGFDTHDDQNNDQANLLATVSDAMKRFYDATVQLGVSQDVVAFTQSDFGRTLTSNGDGTDHAWGGVQLLVGGSVQGGRIYGTYPLLRINATLGLDGADDVGAGRFIPTISSDQYAATLARWLGVADSNLTQIAPSINNFTARDLGFLV